ncbi:DUF1816 domain-containing protein [Microcoleus sp. FACHB-1515]|uniref:DUF1816 domain-containing protein n=1 Tax=Cyanophyceae TaxID=3028117 RepID=UPI001682080B|nr:DUF1816 domain-containing protein [Microcoleus sp. FACHB-1515]MBD2093019.1 DUF1816 domain-containing protein [Microcoleus sp. FACHB-1515]
MKEIWITLLEALGQAWWVEVVTEAPRCTYYFGPFASASEAEAAKSGYVQDLEQENAQNIRAVVRRCKPASLTIEHEAEATRSGKPPSLMSSRA